MRASAMQMLLFVMTLGLQHVSGVRSKAENGEDSTRLWSDRDNATLN